MYFINAGNLLTGDTLISVNGEDLLVSSCYIEECEFATTVYNFQVEDYHTYFVGECEVWVHNAEYGNGNYNNPSDNPKVLADAIENSNAVYGYSPKEDGSLKNFVNKDWSDPAVVEAAKQDRLAYIADDQAINRLVSDMKNQGYSSEDIALAACDFRNQTRLNSYIDANGNITDYDGYTVALERMTTRSYDALGRVDTKFLHGFSSIILLRTRQIFLTQLSAEFAENAGERL